MRNQKQNSLHLFQSTSYWGQQQTIGPALEPEIPSTHMLAGVESPPSDAQLTTKQLEDWSHRLQSAAYQAGDNHLDVLESDLLDLRDEVIFELHSRL